MLGSDLTSAQPCHASALLWWVCDELLQLAWQHSDGSGSSGLGLVSTFAAIVDVFEVLGLGVEEL